MRESNRNISSLYYNFFPVITGLMYVSLSPSSPNGAADIDFSTQPCRLARLCHYELPVCEARVTGQCPPFIHPDIVHSVVYKDQAAGTGVTASPLVRFSAYYLYLNV